MALPYQINDAVLLSREREGIIRYIGKVHFSKGIWCGIELIGGSLGTNDGKIHGRRYFSCPRNRGLFCKINKVRRKFRKRDDSASSRQKRKASLEQRLYHQSIIENVIKSELDLKKKYAKKGRSYKMDVDHIQLKDTRHSTHNKTSWMNERLRTTSTRELKQKSNTPKPFKPGPRDIGRTTDWKPIDYTEPANDKGSFMDERYHSPSTSKLKRMRSKHSAHKAYKAGPRDIGRHNTKNTGWAPIALSKEEEARLNSGKFLDERQSTPKSTYWRRKKKQKSKEFKAGPRDIGRNSSGKGWTPIELSKEERDKLNAGSFLDDRLSKKRNKKASSSVRGKIFKPGPRDIGRNKQWNPKPLSKKKKQFKIALNNSDVDPAQLRRTKQENKALMKGKKQKKNRGKKRKNKRKMKANEEEIVITQRNRNQSMFDSFRVDTRKQSRYNNNDTHRQSARVRLNKQNEAIKQKKHKQNKQKKTKMKQRHSETYASSRSARGNSNPKAKFNVKGLIRNTAIVNNAKFTPYNAITRHRNSVHDHTNYQNFTAYNPNDNKENIDQSNYRKKTYSASNASEANSLSLDEDEPSYQDEIQLTKTEDTSDQTVYELFGEDSTQKKEEISAPSSPKLSGSITPPHVDFEEHEISDNEPNGSGNGSPSGHGHIVYDSSPSGHDRLFDFDIVPPESQSPPQRPVIKNESSLTASLFSDDDDEHTKHIRQYNVPNKPLPHAPPPHKPLPKKKQKRKKKAGVKGRIKGIEKYAGKWSVSFKEIKPKPAAAIRTRKNRSSSKGKKKAMKAFIYSIYKDGSVQIEPKSAFGWNGCGNIEFHDRYEIHPMDLSVSDEYEWISMNRNGTLYIEHFNGSTHSIKPMIGKGTRC